MNLSNDDLKRILLKLHIDPAYPADTDLMERIQEALDNSCEDDIDCPHCHGSGRVSDDFLTDDFVYEVFGDYCDIFGFHYAYGVEKYHDGWDSKVTIVQDTSARGCYNSETHSLPKSYFTRNVEKRRALMQSDRDEEKRKIAAKKAEENQKRIAKLEQELAKLKGTDE